MADEPPTADVIIRLRSQLVDCWERGERIAVESLVQSAGIEPTDDALMELVLSEFEIRVDFGDRPSEDEYFRRFPQFCDRLARLFALRQAMERSRFDAASKSQIVETELRQTAEPGLNQDERRGPHTSARLGRFGDYELLSEIASGGMGVVFKAKHIELGRITALKLIKSGTLADDEEVRRFQIEAQAVAQLDHSGIVAVYDVGQHAGQNYMAMAYIDGHTLWHRVKESPLPPVDAARIIQQVAGAIQYAHDKGIIHRDLKPQNILMTADGCPKVVDFGLAKKAGDCTLTATGHIVGTAAYMPPEQASGRHDIVGPPADIYSLGATLYCLITGRPPFQAATQLETMRQVLEQEPVSPRELNTEVSKDLETICLKCLQKDCAKRYVSAKELSDDLGRFVCNEPIMARPVGQFERTWRWCRRNPSLSGLIISFSILLPAIAVISTAAYFREARMVTEITAAHRIAAQTAYNALIGQVAIDASSTERTRTNAKLEATDWELRGWEYGYLRTKLNGFCRMSSATHGAVEGVAYSPDGEKIFTAGWDKIARVIDARTGLELLSLQGHDNRVVSAAWSPDGSCVLTGSYDGTARSWDVGTGMVLVTFKGHSSRVDDAQFSPDGRRIVTASWDCTARIWDAVTGQEVVRLTGHAGPVHTASWSPDGTRIITASKDKTARVWSPTNGDELVQLRGHEDEVHSAVWAPDGTRVLTASMDATARVWDWKEARELAALRGHDKWIISVACSPDGLRVATGSKDSTARIWNLQTGTSIAIFSGHAGWVHSVAWSPDGSSLATGSDDGAACIWDVASAMQDAPESVRPHAMLVTSAAWNPHGDRIATACLDGTAQILDLQGKTITTLQGHQGTIWSIRWSTDGKQLVTASGDRSARVWDAQTGLTTAVFAGHSMPVLAAEFDPRGTRIVTGSDDRTSVVWDVDSRRPIVTFRGHTAPVWCVAWNREGSQVCSGSEDSTVQGWDAQTGLQKSLFKEHSGLIRSIQWSPDGTLLLTSSEDSTAQIRDAATGSVRILRGHARKLFSAAWSPDGRRVVTGSEDETVRVWDPSTGFELIRMHPAKGEVWPTAFSPDGRFVLAGLSDGSLKIWDGRFVNDIPNFAFPIKSTSTQILFSSDSRKLIFRDAGNSETKTELPRVLFPEINPPAVQPGEDIVSPNRRFGAIRRGKLVAVIGRTSLSAGYDPLQAEADRRKEILLGWHAREATTACTNGNSFAAAFHIVWLERLEPYRAKVLLENLSENGEFVVAVRRLVQEMQSNIREPQRSSK